MTETREKLLEALGWFGVVREDHDAIADRFFAPLEEREEVITDGCDDLGNGKYAVCVSPAQLAFLWERGIVYEDTISDYVESSNRRHFHPAHQDGYGIVDVVTRVHAMECGEHGAGLR